MGQKGVNENDIYLSHLSEDSDNLLSVNCENGVEIICSRCGLAEASDYFRAMLFGSFCERDYNAINLPQVPAELLVTLLSFYKQKNTNLRKGNFGDDDIVDLHHAWSLVEVADMLNLKHAADVCDRYICSRTNVGNSVEICLLADLFSRSSVKQEAIRTMAVTQYGKLVENMICFDQEKLERVYMTKTSFQVTVNHSEMSEKSLELDKVNKEAQNLMILERGNPGIDKVLQRYEFTHDFYVVGGYNFNFKSDINCWKASADDFVEFVDIDDVTSDDDSSSDEECGAEKRTNLKREQTRKVSSKYGSRLNFPDKTVEDYRVVSVRSDVYVIGGFYYDKLEPTNSTWRYDTRRNSWHQMAKMKFKRLHHCAAVVGDVIYACGGYDGSLVHSTTESFDTKRNVWIAQPNMPIGVGNAACTSHGVSVYVICGQFGVKSIHTTRKVQQFNSVTRQWSLPSEYDSPVFHPLSEYGLSCGVIGDDILMVGGQTCRVDCYNVKTNTWRRLADMKCRRIDACTLTYRGRLLVVGGYEYNTGKFFDTIEVFSMDENKWFISQSRLACPAKNVGFCYVFDVSVQS